MAACAGSSNATALARLVSSELDDGEDIFVGAGALQRSGISGLREGERLEFEVAPSQRGTQAVEIRRV